MPGNIKGRTIIPGGASSTKWDEEAIATETISIGDILNVVGMTGDFKRVSKADADVAADVRGVLYIAKSKGRNGLRMRIARQGLITGATTGSTVGDPVYLSATPGSLSLTPVASGRKVGSVAVVGAAGVGKVDFDGSPPGGAFKMGIAAVAGAANVTITAATLEGAYGGRPVVATTNTGTTIHVLTAEWSANDLVITFSASYTGDVSYLIGLV